MPGQQTSAELADAIRSNDREQSDRALEELRQRLLDDRTREEAIDSLLWAFQSYIDERSTAAVFRQTRATFSAQDIAQSARWKVAVKLREGKLDPLSVPQFKAYLRSVVDHFAISLLRKKSRSGVAQESEEESAIDVVADTNPTASRQVAESELFEIVKRHLQADEYKLLRLRILGDHSWEEVAEELYPADSPDQRVKRVEQVRMRLKRALEKLQGHLGDFTPLLDR
ncbi:MAG: sigma-70 family RNA polymerase sigma factor [Planctomycetaceae bacterium]